MKISSVRIDVEGGRLDGVGKLNLTGPANFARATVASHISTAPIWAAAGNQIDYTGTAIATIFPDAPQAGAERTLICASTAAFTAGSNMLIDGVASGSTLTCEAADTIIVRALSTTQFKITYIPKAGVGYIHIPQNSQSANYTLVAADAGKHIFHPSGDANARTFTIPANSSVAYAVGTAISFINMTANVVTIAITTDTMYLAKDGTTGSRSLAIYGSATALKMTSTTWLISGSGLT